MYAAVLLHVVRRTSHADAGVTVMYAAAVPAASSGTSTWTYLWKPAGEVVHDDSSDERLAQTSGQADKRVLQQSGLDDVHLVCPLVDCSWVYPVLGIRPAAAAADYEQDKGCMLSTGTET